LASRAPFLCLMVAHLEWPLMRGPNPNGEPRAEQGSPSQGIVTRVLAMNPSSAAWATETNAS
jgi:hypothetical protein